MPVIGKLDEQVHSILIAPLANPNAAARETHPEEDAPRTEKARPREIATNETTEAEERADTQTSLPVWLL